VPLEFKNIIEVPQIAVDRGHRGFDVIREKGILSVKVQDRSFDNTNDSKPKGGESSRY
jgi:hypothetical protein